MQTKMTEHLHDTLINPKKVWIPIGLFLSLVASIWGLGIWVGSNFTEIKYRISYLEMGGMNEVQIRSIVKEAVNEGFENKIPSLIIQLDERYQKKNEK